jgi:hypothetical protein
MLGGAIMQLSADPIILLHKWGQGFSALVFDSIRMSRAHERSLASGPCPQTCSMLANLPPFSLRICAGGPAGVGFGGGAPKANGC